MSVQARPQVSVPNSFNEWGELPREFTDWLRALDDVREGLSRKMGRGSQFMGNRFSWDVDSGMPLETIVYYWNGSGELPAPEEVVQNIAEGMRGLS